MLRPAKLGADERRLLRTAAAAEVGAPLGAVGWEQMGAREYYDYHRTIYSDITHKAIVVDAVGVLLAPNVNAR
jgi:hypothetical protein